VSAQEPRLKVSGLANIAATANALESLIDIAYVDEVSSEAVFLIGDVGTDLNNPADLEWLENLIVEILEQIGVSGAQFSVL
jgi:hypothetical protein